MLSLTGLEKDTNKNITAADICSLKGPAADGDLFKNTRMVLCSRGTTYVLLFLRTFSLNGTGKYAKALHKKHKGDALGQQHKEHPYLLG